MGSEAETKLPLVLTDGEMTIYASVAKRLYDHFVALV